MMVHLSTRAIPVKLDGSVIGWKEPRSKRRWEAVSTNGSSLGWFKLEAAATLAIVNLYEEAKLNGVNHA